MPLVQVLVPKALSERLQLIAARLPEDRFDREPEGELDSFACRSRWCDDDDPARGAGADKRGTVGRKVRIPNVAKSIAPGYDCGYPIGFGGAFGGAGSGSRITGPVVLTVDARTPDCRSPERTGVAAAAGLAGTKAFEATLAERAGGSLT